MHQHDCVLQKAVELPPGEYAASLMNKPTVSQEGIKPLLERAEEQFLRLKHLWLDGA